VPNESRITINGYVLLFALGISMLTGILFGLAPALRSSRPDLVGTLKDGGGGATGSVRGRAMRSWLVVAEIALSVILLAGASLAVRGFVQMLRVDPGFQPERVLRIGVTMAPKRYPTWQERNALDRNLLASVANLPGVQAAELGNGGIPYSGWLSAFTIAGQPRIDGRKVALALVSSQYPQTLGIPLKRGREFTEAELESGTRVALINESAAKLWPAGQNPVGREMQIDDLAQAPDNPQVLAAPGAADCGSDRRYQEQWAERGHVSGGVPAVHAVCAAPARFGGAHGGRSAGYCECGAAEGARSRQGPGSEQAEHARRSAG